MEKSLNHQASLKITRRGTYVQKQHAVKRPLQLCQTPFEKKPKLRLKKSQIG